MGERRWDTGAAAPGKSYGEAICSAARPASCDVFSAKALSAVRVDCRSEWTGAAVGR